MKTYFGKCSNDDQTGQNSNIPNPNPKRMPISDSRRKSYADPKFGFQIALTTLNCSITLTANEPSLAVINLKLQGFQGQ